MMRSAQPAVRGKAGLVWSLLNETIDEFARDRGELLAAALAFYTCFQWHRS
jgi:uncharacterized BrkB/YihY/UPF0761 family membrane protein